MKIRAYLCILGRSMQARRLVKNEKMFIQYTMAAIIMSIRGVGGRTLFTFTPPEQWFVPQAM